MSDQLYIKVMRGKRVTYEPYQPPEVEPTVYDLTEAQCLTVAGALGVTLLAIFERFIPPHKRNARKIKAVENAVLELFQGSGQGVDMAVCTHVCKCWDMTMKLAEFGEATE